MRSLTIVLLLALSAAAEPSHDASFWRGIIENDYAVPEGASPAALLQELSGLLGSTDPEERDTFGYGIPVRWIYVQKLLSPEELAALAAAWTANLRVGIGESGTDTVLLRSFSALDLSILVALDNEQPWLDRDGFAALLDAALAYLAAEKDVRGYVPGTGWHHSAAHTADLLKFLGRSRHLRAPEQRRILDGIAARLDAGQVFGWGEDERLARAVLSLLARPDLDEAAVAGWLEGLAAGARGLWDGELDPARFAAVQNAKNLLRSLYVLLQGMKEKPAAVSTLEGKILETLQAL